MVIFIEHTGPHPETGQTVYWSKLIYNRYYIIPAWNNISYNHKIFIDRWINK